MPFFKASQSLFWEQHLRQDPDSQHGQFPLKHYCWLNTFLADIPSTCVRLNIFCEHVFNLRWLMSTKGPAGLALFIPEASYHWERGNTQVKFKSLAVIQSKSKYTYGKKKGKLTIRLGSARWLQEALHIYFFSLGDKRSFIGLCVFFVNQNELSGIRILPQSSRIYIYICK